MGLYKHACVTYTGLNHVARSTVQIFDMSLKKMAAPLQMLLTQ